MYIKNLNCESQKLELIYCDNEKSHFIVIQDESRKVSYSIFRASN